MILIARKLKNSDIESTYFEKSHGTLTEGLWVRGIVGRYWTVITLIRWSCLNLMLVVLSQWPMLQIYTLLGQSLGIQILIIHGKPMLSQA